MSSNLFYTVMEAEGEALQPFDGGNDIDVGDANMNDAPQQSDPANEVPPDTSSDDSPPDLADDTDMSFDENGESSIDNGDDETPKEDTKLSEKANNILNQKLYQQMLNRNDEINEIINNVQLLIPLLPYEVVKTNDKSLNRLKSALSEGQRYVINKFVDAKYGENSLFYQKIDTLYNLLLNEIDNNLKKIKK